MIDDWPVKFACVVAGAFCGFVLKLWFDEKDDRP